MSKVFRSKIVLLFCGTAFLFICSPSNVRTQSVSCPKIEMLLPAGIIQVEEKATLVLSVPGGFDFSVEWGVSAGLIVNGQGTTAITFVPSEEDAGKRVKIVAKISNIPSGCPSEFEDLLGVMDLPHWESLDEIGKSPKNDLRGRLDSYFAELSNNPTNIGLIEIYFEKKDSRRHKLDHLKTILKHFEFRKFDVSRVKFTITDGENQQATKFWRYPPDARLPKAWRNYKFINGPELIREAKTLIK